MRRAGSGNRSEEEEWLTRCSRVKGKWLNTFLPGYILLQRLADPPADLPLRKAESAATQCLNGGLSLRTQLRPADSPGGAITTWNEDTVGKKTRRPSTRISLSGWLQKLNCWKNVATGSLFPAHKGGGGIERRPDWCHLTPHSLAAAAAATGQLQGRAGLVPSVSPRGAFLSAAWWGRRGSECSRWYRTAVWSLRSSGKKTWSSVRK